MSIIFYSSDQTAGDKYLWNLYQNIKNHNDAAFCSTIEQLILILKNTMEEPKIAVLFASDRQNLNEILSMHEYFYSYRIILILPDKEEETLKKGFKLFPRFLSFATDGLKQVNDVLNKMLLPYDASQNNCRC